MHGKKKNSKEQNPTVKTNWEQLFKMHYIEICEQILSRAKSLPENHPDREILISIGEDGDLPGKQFGFQELIHFGETGELPDLLR